MDADLMIEEIELDRLGEAAAGSPWSPGIQHTEPETTSGLLLTAIEALVIAAEVGPAKGIAIWTEWTHRWIVAGSIVKSAVALGMVAEAVVGIARSVFGAGTESFMIGSRDQRWNAVIWRGRRWRSCDIVGMRSAADGRETSGCNKKKCSTGRFHSALTIQQRNQVSIARFE
jgi:hypothetical protein